MSEKLVEVQEKRDKAFQDACVQGQKLFHVKNLQYGDAIRFLGLIGVVCELIGAVMRLPQIVLRDPTYGRSHADKIKDILLDIHNYAAIGLILMEEDNYEGTLLQDFIGVEETYGKNIAK